MKDYTSAFITYHQICHGGTYIHITASDSKFEEIQYDAVTYTIINCLCNTGHTSIKVIASGIIDRVDYGHRHSSSFELLKIPACDDKFSCSITRKEEQYHYYYLFDKGIVYCVAAKQSVCQQLVMTFLEGIENDFTKKYGGKVVKGSFSKEFELRMRRIAWTRR